jgi:ABC-type transport system substrate-binding protein
MHSSLSTNHKSARGWIRALSLFAISVLIAGSVITQTTGAQITGTQTSGSSKKNIVVSYRDDFATLDPALGYDPQSWPASKMLFDGLVDYKPGTSQLEPRIAAAMPTVSKDGRTFTFKLRTDIRFTNGRQLVAKDVKYSLERTLNPTTKSPGLSFLSNIYGSKAFMEGRDVQVGGIETPDAQTVKIRLIEANATFLNVMAMNFAFVVPREAVESAKPNFGRQPIGSGPFMLESWIAGKSATFVRNPKYFRQGFPKLDRVTVKLGIGQAAAFAAFKRGEVDLLGNELKSSEFLNAKNDPKLGALLTSYPQGKVRYLGINTEMPPFNNLQVRQALSHAINKQLLLEVIAGRGVIAQQILPPNIPGFDRAYEGYEYDPGKARELLKQAGLEQGFSSTIHTFATEPNPQIAKRIQTDLARIGIRISIKLLDKPKLLELASTPKTVPLVLSQWAQDFPDPSVFYWPVLSCRSAKQGDFNWSFACSKLFDRLASNADQMAAPAQRHTRALEYRELFARLMQQAPWVPLLHPLRYTLHSARLTGQAYDFIDPVHYVAFERLAIK